MPPSKFQSCLNDPGPLNSKGRHGIPMQNTISQLNLQEVVLNFGQSDQYFSQNEKKGKNMCFVFFPKKLFFFPSFQSNPGDQALLEEVPLTRFETGQCVLCVFSWTASLDPLRTYPMRTLTQPVPLHWRGPTALGAVCTRFALGRFWRDL